MNFGCDFVQAAAFCLLSKKRSITIAFRSSAVRPDARAALRFVTAGPVSLAVHSPSSNVTLLPYGTFFGSTAQWPSRKAVPVAAAFAEPPSPRQYAVTRAFAVRSSANSSQEKTRTSPSVVINLFIHPFPYNSDEAEIRNNGP